MNSRIRTLTLAAAGALAMAWTAPVLAAGKCVTIAHDVASGEKLNLDPARNVVLDGAGLIVTIYDALVDFDSNFQLIPRLATSWESNADATEWTFKLREGVKFHDGTDFDASDVVYTYRRILDPDLGSPGRALLAFLEPEGIEAVDAHTVRFTTKNPTPQLPTQIKSRFVHIVPEGATAEDMENHGVGTGPFILDKDFDKGAPFWEVTRNPDYWQPDIPKAECVRFTAVLEPITRAAALISGEIDVATAVDPQLVPLLDANADVNVVKASGGASIALSMWVDTPPFDDVRVRQALKAVVDRQAIVDGALFGLGEAGADSPIPPSSPFAYLSDPPQRDVARARQLLAEAGYPDGLDVSLHVAPAAVGYMNVAQAFVQMAAEAGIKVKLNQVPAGTYWSETWLKVPFMVSGWGPRPPSAALSVAYRKEAVWNETHWFRDDYDALLDRADATLDEAERIELWKQAQKMLVEESGTVVTSFFPSIAVLRAECTGHVPHPSRFYFDFREVMCNR
jgi:peptide/nickel transport system substrate-binding protein